jgi:hypothetical protein
MLKKLAPLTAVLALALTAPARAYDSVGWVGPGDANLSCGEAKMIGSYAWHVFGRGDLLNVTCEWKPSASSYWIKGGDMAAPSVGVWRCLLDFDATGVHAQATQVGCNRQ